MNELPIADCRLPINKSRARCSFARGGHNGSKLIGFRQQCRQFLAWHNAGLGQQFEPEGGFVGFLFNGSDFSNKFSLASRAATGAIVCRDRSSAANDLSRNRPAGSCFWNGTGQFDDSQCKFFGAEFEFNGIHGMKLQTQSAIGNRQSAIGNHLR